MSAALKELAERARVVQEALSWAGTPYHHMGRVKGAGVDCGEFLAMVYDAAGVTPEIIPAAYHHDWHLHRGEEKYLAIVEAFAHRIPGPPLPGDIVLYQFGRCISHGAIVIQWPQIIHSYVGKGVILDDGVSNLALAPRQRGFWSCWGGA